MGGQSGGGKCQGGWQMESDMRGLADGKCYGVGRWKVTGGVGKRKVTGGDCQMESDRRGLADGKWQEGVGRWKVSGELVVGK